MANLTLFGKECKKRLIDLDKPQTWLIEQVRAATGLYFDDSYLYKIQTGRYRRLKLLQQLKRFLRCRSRNKKAHQR